MPPDTELKRRFADITQGIIDSKPTHRAATSVTSLVAVSKNQPTEAIRTLIALGQTAFAESYLQEAIPKIQQLNDPALIWHYIGRLQSNKTKEIATQFDWVQSLHRLKIAQRLDRARAANAMPPLNVLVQVNIDGAITKAGIAPEAVTSFCDALNPFTHLKLRGLMAIPNTTNTNKHCFEHMHQLFMRYQSRYQWDTLSMGMSSDYHLAIAAGATMVRVGQKLFGERKQTT